MKSQAAGEIWHWSLLGMKGLSVCDRVQAPSDRKSNGTIDTMLLTLTPFQIQRPMTRAKTRPARPVWTKARAKWPRFKSQLCLWIKWRKREMFNPVKWGGKREDEERNWNSCVSTVSHGAGVRTAKYSSLGRRFGGQDGTVGKRTLW